MRQHAPKVQNLALALAIAMLCLAFWAGAALAAQPATDEPARPVISESERRTAAPQSTEIDYRTYASEDVKGVRLVLECTLPKPLSESTLTLLGKKIYADYNGDSYGQVRINWRIGDAPHSGQPWAVTDLTKSGSTVRILQ